jgi:hypothetical protein
MMPEWAHPLAFSPAPDPAAFHERRVNPRVRFRSSILPYGLPEHRPWKGQGEDAMSEFIRSGAIMLMAVVVLAAGVAVIFYG